MIVFVDFPEAFDTITVSTDLNQGCGVGVGEIFNYGVGISKKIGVGVGISGKLGVGIYQISVVGVGD